MTAATTPPAAFARSTLRVLLGCCLAIVPLKQLLTDSAWLVDAWVGMGLVVLPAAALRSRRPPASWQLLPGLLAAAFFLTASMLRTSAFAGFIPTPQSWHQMSSLASQVSETSAHSTAPLSSTPAIRFFLTLGLALLAALVDVIALELGHPALAGVPFLLLFTLAGAVPRHPVGWLWSGLAIIGFLLVLSAHAGSELPRWGRVVQRDPNARRGLVGTTRSARPITAAVVVLALLIPALLPVRSVDLIANALHNGNSSTGGKDGTGGVALDQLASLRGSLVRSAPVDLFSVSVPSVSGASPYYLREGVLDSYNGSAWVPGPSGPHQPVRTGSQFSSDPVVIPDATDISRFQATITVQNLVGNAPGFTFPTAVSGLGRGWSWDTEAQLITGTGVRTGLRYTEQIDQPDPSAAQLEAAGSVGPDPSLAPYLKLPSIPNSVKQQVTKLITGAQTEYERTLAISEFFTPANGFTYSLQTKTGESGNDLVDFLKARTGFCQQYAAAMAVMLRLAGVPSRVVVGYTHAAPDSSGNFEVTTDDAHAWDEAYFAGIGWIPFDPTPLAGADAARAVPLTYATPPADTITNDPGVVKTRDTGTATAAATATTRTGTTSTPAVERPAVGISPKALWIAALIAALVLLALSPALLRVRRRRARLRAGRRGRPEAVWAELAETCADLGLGWSWARTPRQVADWLREFGLATGPGTAETSAALGIVASAVEAERYRPGPGDIAGGTVVEALRTIRAALLAGLGPRRRLLAALVPASLRDRLRLGRDSRTRAPQDLPPRRPQHTS